MKAPNHSAPRRPGSTIRDRWRRWLGLVLIPGMSAGVQAQNAGSLDTLFMIRGEKMVGRLIGLDKSSYRLKRPLSPPANAPPGTPIVFATVTIPRMGVDYIVFAPDSRRDSLLKTATREDLAKIAGWWEQAEPWLGIPRSPAARIGLVYGDLLLRSEEPGQAKKALTLFQQIEAGSWSQADDMEARQGRLRAMVATGRAEEAVQEAAELAKISEDPTVLMQAKFVLAAAADEKLHHLVEENPRWTEDVYVIPERNRLYHEALDLYLYPGLFAGAESEASARGIWGAVGVYQFAGEWPEAVELSRDLLTIHPGTKYATLARKFLEGLPEEWKNQDAEKEARETLHDLKSPQPDEK